MATDDGSQNKKVTPPWMHHSHHQQRENKMIDVFVAIHASVAVGHENFDYEHCSLLQLCNSSLRLQPWCQSVIVGLQALNMSSMNPCLSLGCGAICALHVGSFADVWLLYTKQTLGLAALTYKLLRLVPELYGLQL